MVLIENKKIYNKNIGAFNKKYPNVLNDQLDDIMHSNISVESTKDNHFTIKITKDGRSIYTNSKYSSQEEAQRFIDNLPEHDYNTLFIVYGLGLGYHIRKMQQKIKDTNNIIVIIEPETAILMTAFQVEDFTGIINDSKTLIVVGEDAKQFREVITNVVSLSNINNFQVSIFSQYDKINGHYFMIVADGIKKAIAEIKVQISTINYFAYDFNRNFLNNFPDIIDNYMIQNIKNKFEHIPAFIVSGGPSLDKNIQYLKNVKDKAVILAGGRTIDVLFKENIIPNFIVSIDPGIGALRLLREHADTDIPLITTVVSNDSVVEKNTGKKLFISTSEYTDLIEHLTNNKLGELPQGGSVANICLSVAHYMGCDPIIFVGQDLAFTDGLKHAESAKNRAKNKSNVISKGDLKVPGIYGDEVETSWQLYTFLKWFEDFIQVYPNRIYINSTQGGANISGTEVMDLADAIDKCCQENHDFASIYGEIFANKINVDIHDVYRKFAELQKDCLNVKEKAGQALLFNEQMLDYYSHKNKCNINKLIKKLSKLEKEILKSKKNNLVINRIIHPVLVQLEVSKEFKEKPNETEFQQGIRVAKYSIALYGGIVKAIDSIEQLIEDNLLVIKRKAKGDINGNS